MAGPVSTQVASAVANGSSATTATDDATRGRPYYEKLRRELKQTIDEKRKLDLITAQTEERIAKLEAAYLEETSAAGNIVKGFDNYIKASASGGGATSTGGGTATRRKGGISEQDKIFSKSSVSWSNDAPLTLSLSGAVAAANATGPASSGGTPSGRDTPVSTGPGPAHKKGNKRKGKAAAAASEQAKESTADDAEEKTTKRGKISWGPKD